MINFYKAFLGLYGPKPLEEKKSTWIEIQCPICGDMAIAAPPKSKPWVGLTDDEVMVAAYQAGFDIHEDYENNDDPEAMHWWTPDGEACDYLLLKLRDIIEAKLREKNA